VLGSRLAAGAAAVAALLLVAPPARAQDAASSVAQAERDRRNFHTASALRGFEQAAADPQVAADAWLGIGRIRAFRGWQAEGAFPGWHEEVDQRPLALAAFRRAAELRPTWAEPHVAIGEALLLDGRAAEARAAFERALTLTAGHPAAARGLARATGAPVADPDADALAAIDAAMKAGQTANQISLARAFVASRPDSPRIFDAYARLLSGLQGLADGPVAELDAAIDGRLALRPDPLAYSTAINLLNTRGVRLDRARELAVAGMAAGERFITENEPSYKLDGKVQASRDRNRAQFTDLLGWTAFRQGDLTTAGQKLDEAARYSSGTDFLNQFHRGQLARHKGEAGTARERFFDALSLDAPPFLAPLRETAESALAAIYAAEGTAAADAATAIARELERRREDRRRSLLASAVGRPLPKLPTTTVAGTPVDLLAERGNVTLLNFFAAW
jgi:tetratricopeptide (TPR) repeat protein